MNIFSRLRKKPNNDNNLIQLLKQSHQGFLFDSDKVKLRLRHSMAQTEQTPAARYFMAFPILRYAGMAAGLVLVVSGTLVYASTQSVPGDVLFEVTKLKEQVVLGLKFDIESRAEYETLIVTNRLESLSKIEEQIEVTNAKINTRKLQTIEESDNTLTKAIQSVAAQQQSLDKEGRKMDSEKLSKTLAKLEILAGEYEKKIESMESNESDEPTREFIKKHLIKIREARAQAQEQLTNHLQKD